MAALNTENIIGPLTDSMTAAIKNSSAQKIPGFQKLVFKGNKFDRTIQYREYVESIENEFTVHGITEPNRKKAAFIHHVGNELWIQAQAMPESTDNNLDAYQKTKLRFEQAFCMINPEEAARNAFDEFEPERNEFVYQGYMRLHRISRLCNYDDTNDRILRKLRQKYVTGAQNLKWRENSRDMNFANAISEARRLDSLRAEIELLSKSNSSGQVHSVKKGVGRCKWCSGSHKPKQCPAWGKTCHNCGQQNHYASCCPKKSSGNGNRGQQRGQNHYRQNHQNSSNRRGSGKRRGRSGYRNRGGYNNRQGRVNNIDEETNQEQQQQPRSSFAEAAAGQLAGRVKSIQLC